MNDWMRRLGLHYETMRALYPEDNLMVVFDIDGTIIDMRQMVLHSFRAFDDMNGTSVFKNISLEDIYVDENTVGRLLIELKVPPDIRKTFMEWYTSYRVSENAIMESHKPFKGVMEIIKWFYDRTNTFVSLNTGRPEEIRKTTLSLLNKIGKEYGIYFPNRFLYMNPYDWNTDCVDIKAEGIEYFRKQGYRVIAFIDNEPENLLSVSRINRNGDILLLHASTIYKSSLEMLPPNAVSGTTYDIRNLSY